MAMFGSMMPAPQVPQFQGLNVPALNLPPAAAPQAQPQPAPQTQPMPQQAAPQTLPQQQPTYPGLKRPPPKIGTTINGYTYMGGDPRSTDPNVWKPASGDTFLNSLPIDDTKKALIKAVANYDLPPGTQRGSFSNPSVQQILGLVKQYNPDFSASDYAVRQQTRQEFAKGAYSKTITALNTAIDHALQLSNAGDKLNNYQSPTLNAVGNAYDQYVAGDPRQSNYKQIAQLLSGEVVKAATGNTGAEGDRAQQIENYPLNGSPDQQHQAVATTVGLLKSKLDELNAAYKRGMGRGHDVTELLSPSARKSWMALSSEYGDVGPDGTAVPKAAPATASAPQGVDPNIWAHMTPQEKALWH